jgi:hypothetical protein
MRPLLDIMENKPNMMTHLPLSLHTAQFIETRIVLSLLTPTLPTSVPTATTILMAIHLKPITLLTHNLLFSLSGMMRHHRPIMHILKRQYLSLSNTMLFLRLRFMPSPKHHYYPTLNLDLHLSRWRTMQLLVSRTDIPRKTMKMRLPQHTKLPIPL